MALSFARTLPSDKDIIKKSKTTVSRGSIKGGGNLAAQIQAISTMAEAKLAHHKDDYIIIRDPDQLYEYLREMKHVGEGALDTETTGLNPLLVDIVGGCLYTPGQKSAYIPINHRSYVTGQRTKDQLTEEQVAKLLNEFKNDIQWIMHNAPFDIRVVRHTLGVDLKCFWDTRIAACCIDENESHSLKDLHLKYCDSTDTESLTFDKLFKGVRFDYVPISVAYLYAAGDPIKTYQLKEYQKTLLNRRVLAGPYNVFMNIEMPIIDVVCDMEDRGVCLDFDVSKKLHDKYHTLKEDYTKKADEAVSMYSELIDNYKMQNPSVKIDSPINLSSPTQLAVLFYDILKLKSPDARSPRGTGEDILKHFAKGAEKNLCEAILNIRGVDKLLSTYIDKMPQIVHADGRIHGSYNQYGAKTGRFSSSDPNMQNIPSHNKDIRQMFKARDGYVLIGSDFSQQEPMVTSFLSQDRTMMDAFIQGKDIYATIASLAFKKPYEECKEFRPDGTTNPAGKERRSQAKSIVLGILYGRQIPSIAEQLDVSVKEAQNIYDTVLRAFPALANFIQESQGMAKELGYVTTAWGRRRHLPDMQLEPYEFSTITGNPIGFDPLSFTSNIDTTIPEALKRKYTKMLNEAFGWKKKQQIIEELRAQGIKVKDNCGFIAQAERQCVNARVQGSSADITKLAMIDINTDQQLKDLGFSLLISVHDEVIGECPIENAKACADRLSYIMRTAPTRLIDLPFKCDCEIVRNWYGESVEVE